MPITARFTMSPHLLYRAQIAVLRQITWMRWGGVFIVGLFPLIMIAITLGSGASFGEALRHELPVIVGFLLVWLVGIPLAQRWGARRTFHATPAAQGERTYTIDDEQIVIAGDVSTGTLRWSAIVRVVETADLFLLFVSSQMAHFIPKSAFASAADVDELRRLVASKRLPSSR